MDSDWFLRFVFILYCTTVGAALVAIPWSPGWDQVVALLPYAGLHFLKLPVVRGGLSGFGLVHLVWGFHDLFDLVRSTHGKTHSQASRDQ